MELVEVTAAEYNKGNRAVLVYDSEPFLELNKEKVQAVHYYIFRDKKDRFRLALGERVDKGLYGPYSAPFGLMEDVQRHWTLEQLDEAVACLDAHAKKEGHSNVRFILPPAFYYPKMVTGMMGSLLRNAYQVSWQDMNYALPLRKLYVPSYGSMLRPNARKNLRIALNSGLALVYCSNEAECKEAYDVIAVNRKEKGYPLRMTWEQVRSTIAFMPHDFFLVQKDGVSVASAVVFHPAESIAQVIYWGNILEYAYLKPINFLSYQLIQYYGNKGFDYLDIGPSSEEGVPNYGLCDFKESIGCELTAKFILEKSYCGESNITRQKMSHTSVSGGWD